MLRETGDATQKWARVGAGKPMKSVDEITQVRGNDGENQGNMGGW